MVEKSICTNCFHSYVCEQFNEHRDSGWVNKKCHFFNDHFVPAADVAPVVHGEWINLGVCSNCGKNIYDGIDADIWSRYEPPYCPNCGAKMKED